MKEKIVKYKCLYYVHSIYALLMAVEFYEFFENYEECHAITTAIKEIGSEIEYQLPTRLKDSDFLYLPRSYRAIIKENAKRLTKTKV